MAQVYIKNNSSKKMQLYVNDGFKEEIPENGVISIHLYGANWLHATCEVHVGRGRYSDGGLVDKSSDKFTYNYDSSNVTLEISRSFFSGRPQIRLV